MVDGKLYTTNAQGLQKEKTDSGGRVPGRKGLGNEVGPRYHPTVDRETLCLGTTQPASDTTFRRGIPTKIRWVPDCSHSITLDHARSKSGVRKSPTNYLLPTYSSFPTSLTTSRSKPSTPAMTSTLPESPPPYPPDLHSPVGRGRDPTPNSLASRRPQEGQDSGKRGDWDCV